MLEKNLVALVEEEIAYGKTGEIIQSFTQAERLLYESQDFEYTASGYLMKKKDPLDQDYEWDVLKFIENNPEIKQDVEAMLGRGERLLRKIYTNKETFDVWVDFFNQLKAQGLELEDYVEANDFLSIREDSQDAMSYIDDGISIETVGQGAIYRTEEVHLSEEEKNEQDYLGDVFDHYKTLIKPPRDRYKTIRRVGYTEEQQEGILASERREHRATLICKKLKTLQRQYAVAKYRKALASKWKEDKLIYKQLKEREISISDASEEIYLTVAQWRHVFATANTAWYRASLNEEKHNSPEQKKKRQIKSNGLMKQFIKDVTHCTTRSSIEKLMQGIALNAKYNILWKNDFEKVKQIATNYWQLLPMEAKKDELEKVRN